MEQSEILISQGERALWQLVIAALLYTGMFTCLYYFSTTFNIHDEVKKVKASLVFLELAIFLFLSGISFSIVRDYHFNIKEKKYKILFCIGPIRVGSWKTFENLNYISVFKNNKDKFEVNLWYNKNKHFNISTYGKQNFALLAGKHIAKKLNIDLLDATEPRNSKWVEI